METMCILTGLCMAILLLWCFSPLYYGRPSWFSFPVQRPHSGKVGRRTVISKSVILLEPQSSTTCVFSCPNSSLALLPLKALSFEDSRSPVRTTWEASQRVTALGYSPSSLMSFLGSSPLLRFAHGSLHQLSAILYWDMTSACCSAMWGVFRNEVHCDF